MSREQQNREKSGTSDDHASAARPADAALGRALALVRFLRERCPWDARQTPATLRPYLLEEASEVAEALVREDESGLRAELGDLLLNVAFQIVLAEERGTFGAEDVVSTLERKMRARHPHVYDGAESPPDWEALKAEERAAARAADPAAAAPEPDPFEGVAKGLEALSRAMRLQERAAALNFDWPDAEGPLAKVREETDELAGDLRRKADVTDELGDLLFAVVNVGRLAGVHPAVALDRASGKFAARFRALLRRAAEEGLDPREADLEELERLWTAVKRDPDLTSR
ncbi:MAG: nucleoside triphosphate pyrophosphohydrolase [Gemmatimonadota bacterium]